METTVNRWRAGGTIDQVSHRSRYVNHIVIPLPYRFRSWFLYSIRPFPVQFPLKAHLRREPDSESAHPGSLAAFAAVENLRFCYICSIVIHRYMFLHFMRRSSELHDVDQPKGSIIGSPCATCPGVEVCSTVCTHVLVFPQTYAIHSF